MRKIMVTGYLWIEDSEYDGGPDGPLTEKGWVDAMRYPIHGLEDVTFVEDVADGLDRPCVYCHAYPIDGSTPCPGTGDGMHRRDKVTR